MPICQRVYWPPFTDETFSVTDSTSEESIAQAGGRLCGKPAFYKQVSENGNVVIWICVDCYNEFEAKFGEGSWTETSQFETEDFEEGDEDDGEES